MPQLLTQKLTKLLFLALLVLLVVFLDPKGDVLGRFDKNFKKNSYFETCIPGSNASSTIFDVVEVSDGDTIIISKECAPVSVRFIGIDTPETVDPRKPVQCFGKEASAYTKERLAGTKVSIETDHLTGERDKYGRALGYIILADGTKFNKELIEKGYAHEYTYDGKYAYQTEFKQAEKEARENKRGLWSEETCGGVTK